MYPKAVLVTLIKDVIVSYKITVDKVSHRREQDIAKISDICDVATYDTMVIHSIRGIIRKINYNTEGWFRWTYAPPSRLAQALDNAVSAYERSVRKQEKYAQRVKMHSLNIQHRLDSAVYQPELPSVREIHHQVRGLESNGMKMLMS